VEIQAELRQRLLSFVTPLVVFFLRCHSWKSHSIERDKEKSFN